MYQRIWVPPIPPRRQHFCRVRVWSFIAIIPHNFYAVGLSSSANRACARPTVSLGVSFEALASNLPDGGPSLSSSSHLPGFPSLTRDFRPKCPPAQSCPFAATGFPSLLSSALDVLTPSTVCSTSILGQSFRTDRHVRDSTFRGWCPTHSADRLVTCRCPLVVRHSPSASVATSANLERPAFRALFRAWIRCRFTSV